MKHQDKVSFIMDGQAEQMGADMAIQFMLMMLFQLVSKWRMTRAASVRMFTRN